MDSSSPGLFTMNDSDETVAHHTSTDGDSSSSRGVRRYIRAVSYTHLTLPTIYSV